MSRFDGPLDRVFPRRLARPVHVGFPGIFFPLRVDLDDKGLAPEGVGDFVYQSRSMRSSRVDRDFVRSSQQKSAHVAHRPNTTANTDRDEYFISNAGEKIVQMVAAIKASNDIQK